MSLISEIKARMDDVITKSVSNEKNMIDELLGVVTGNIDGDKEGDVKGHANLLNIDTTV